MRALAGAFLAIAVAAAASPAVEEEPYDEWAECPTVHVEGCGDFPAVRVMVEGRKTESRGLVRDGRTYLAAREILERLGADVRWVQPERAFFASFPERNIVVRVAVGSPDIIVYRFSESQRDGVGQRIRMVNLNAAPFQCEGRVFAPVRAAVDAAGGWCHYDQHTRTVYVGLPESAESHIPEAS